MAKVIQAFSSKYLSQSDGYLADRLHRRGLVDITKIKWDGY